MATRYLETRKSKDGVIYWWVPPRDVRKMGVFKIERLGVDEAHAIRRATELNLVYDKWKSGITGQGATVGTVAHLIQQYQKSTAWMKIAPATRDQYRKGFTYAGAIVFDSGVSFADMSIHQVSRSTVSALYSMLIDNHGIDMANQCYAALRRAWNIAMNDFEMVQNNPFLGRELLKADREQVIWSREEFYALCRKAEAMKLPEVSIAAQIGYWLGQRPVDILNMRWADIMDNKIQIAQQKTGAKFLLPIPQPLADTLDKADAHGPYIVSKRDGSKYQRGDFSKIFAIVRDAAGIPSHLKFAKFRATAATELADAGGTEDELMAVGGWRNRQMVSVYTKRTNRQAENAMKKRMMNR